MPGLTEHEWNFILERLKKIDDIHEKVIDLSNIVTRHQTVLYNGNGLVERVEKLEEAPKEKSKASWSKGLAIAAICVSIIIGVGGLIL